MTDLAEQTCIPCRGGVERLRGADIEKYASRIDAWDVVDEHHLYKAFAFPDFAAALAFTNRVGALAEEQGHHPDLELSWGRVGVKIFTHKIDGLFESDFVLAAKIDRLRS